MPGGIRTPVVLRTPGLQPGAIGRSATDTYLKSVFYTNSVHNKLGDIIAVVNAVNVFIEHNVEMANPDCKMSIWVQLFGIYYNNNFSNISVIDKWEFKYDPDTKQFHRPDGVVPDMYITNKRDVINLINKSVRQILDPETPPPGLEPGT